MNEHGMKTVSVLSTVCELLLDPGFQVSDVLVEACGQMGLGGGELGWVGFRGRYVRLEFEGQIRRLRYHRATQQGHGSYPVRSQPEDNHAPTQASPTD
jgi:hypothetical protein